MAKNRKPLVKDGVVVGTSKTFSAVRKARQILHDRADEILDDYLTTIKLAAANGDFEPALKAYQWLISHGPADEGVRVIDTDIDKQQQAEGPSGPMIQIGFKIGGLPEPKALPAPDKDE